MRKYKFSKLSKKSKIKAAMDYRKGMKAFREKNDIPNLSECLELCTDCENDLIYDVTGKLIGGG